MNKDNIENRRLAYNTTGYLKITDEGLLKILVKKNNVFHSIWQND